jgi:hypothetical protein
VPFFRKKKKLLGMHVGMSAADDTFLCAQTNFFFFGGSRVDKWQLSGQLGQPANQTPLT